ncbi:MAG TPA: sugar phosphate isomerase/epimerase family protein [Ruminiclostridium sp.]|nr:sugar phosphate isomerase/epimerase family protein [Ruminiclostridium sp.]
MHSMEGKGNMLKLSYNTNGLREISVLQAISELKKAGYDGIELALEETQFNPFHLSGDDLKKINESLESNKLYGACIATGSARLLSKEAYEPSLIHPTQSGRNQRIDLLKRSLEIAHALNIPVVNFASGKLTAGLEPERATEFLVEGIEKLLHESDSIILAIEPEPEFFIGTSAEAVSLIKNINNTRFRLNLDIGHVYCCEDNFFEAVEHSIPYAVHMHIEDIADRVHRHLIPGDGEIDFERVFSVIMDNAYEGYISVELYHHADQWQEAITESHQRLIRLMDLKQGKDVQFAG